MHPSSSFNNYGLMVNFGSFIFLSVPLLQIIFREIKIILSINMSPYGLPQCLSSRESTSNARASRDLDLIPGCGKVPWSLGHVFLPLQYSGLANPVDRGSWWATVHSIAKYGTQLNWLSTHTYVTLYTSKIWTHKKYIITCQYYT